MKYKYTNYIVNGNIVDINSLISTNKYMRVITIPIASTVAVAGIAAFACLIPMTITVDSARYVKFHYIMTKRKYNVNYVFLIPIDKLDTVLEKWNIDFNLHNELRKNEINMKVNLLYLHSHVKDIFTIR
jgi:hypothetical protein